MTPFEFARSDTCLVGSKSLNCLGSLGLVQESCSGNIIIEFPVDEWSSDDSDKADKEEDTGRMLALVLRRRKYDVHLPGLECL